MPEWVRGVKKFVDRNLFAGPHHVEGMGAVGSRDCVLCSVTKGKGNVAAITGDIYDCCICLVGWHLTCASFVGSLADAETPRWENTAPFACPGCFAASLVEPWGHPDVLPSSASSSSHALPAEPRVATPQASSSTPPCIRRRAARRPFQSK